MSKSVEAAAGDLDLTFGSGGKVTTDFFGSSDNGLAVIIQPDGKIVVGGAVVNNDRFNFALTRYNTDGSLDSSFGSGGKVITDFGISSGIWDIALQPDGKIVATGFALGNFPLARYNTDGSLDSSFGSGGIVITPSGEARAIVLQPDGKIIIAGRAFDQNANSEFALLRYNSDGSIDFTFGSGGRVTTDFSDANLNIFGDFANSVILQPDGKIVAAGGAATGVGVFDFGLARYNTDGSLDPTFGTGGKVTTPSGVAEAILLQPNGKIIAVGGGTDFTLARYNSNGSLDPTFGTGGTAAADFGAIDIARSIALQPDGKLVVAGTSASPGPPIADFAIARFNSNGSLDSTFGGGGKVVTDFFGHLDTASGIAIQPDSKIVVAGTAFNLSTGGEFALARYEGDGRPQPDFNICLQDESNGNRLQINTATGDYLFTNCGHLASGGRARLNQKGCIITFQHNSSKGRVTAKIDTCSKQGFASFQSPSSGRTFTIIDRNSHNNTCSCQ